MDNKFWNKTTIFGLAGLFAYTVTTLVLFIPFRGEPSMSLVDWRSPLGNIVIILFVISVVLYVYGILKIELRFTDKKAILEERQKYLPQLKKIMQKRLKKAEELRTKSVKLPLSQYFEKYLKRTMPYLVTRRVPTKPLEITNALSRHKFLWNNLHYQSVKDNDTSYKQIITEYDLLYSQIDDKKLRTHLDTIWIREHQSGSLQIFTLISVSNSKIPNTPMGIRGGLFGKRMAEKALIQCIDAFEKRYGILINGGDL